MNDNELNEIFAEYEFDMDDYIGKKPISVGHINTTYTLYFDNGYRVKRYLLQQINVDVFKNPDELMENIENVTIYARDKIRFMPFDNKKNRFIRIYPTKNNKTFIKTKQNQFYRVYHYIEGAKSFNISDNKEVFINAGKAIGTFQNLLSSYPADTLHETIKDFHNTPKRLKTFEETIRKYKNTERYKNCLPEVNFFLLNGDIAFSIHSLLESKEMPLRVTHNDTKLNNILFHHSDLSFLCLCDLDTIMPGSICYDFGDFVRSGCNMGEEDAQDLSQVSFNKEMFKAFAYGYLSCVHQSITPIELSHLTQGAIVMCYECGMRFLTDYLQGSHYFKIAYPEHNLIRCRTQIKMAEQILACKEELDQIIFQLSEQIAKEQSAA